MTQQHLYLAVERINLGDANWNTLINAMQSKGQHNSNNNPVFRNHWRVSNDDTIQIFEAVFESTNIDSEWFANWLANVFDVLVNLIVVNEGFNTYGRFATFSYLAINRIRVGVFGFAQGQGWPSYDQSKSAARQYIEDNSGEWD